MVVEAKHNILVSDKLYQEIKEYCEFNKLKLNTFVETLIKERFAIEKYGVSPFDNFKKDTPLIVEEPVKQTPIEKEEIKEVIPIVEEKPIIPEEPVKVEEKPKKKITRLN